MGLIDRLRGNANNAGDFADRHLDKLMESAELRQYFFDESGKRKTDPGTEALRDSLRDKLVAGYDTDAKSYFEDRGFLSKYVSPVLRGLGFGADVAGTYLFWAMGGAGLGLKAVGAGIKTVADTIDMVHYLRHNHEGYDFGSLPALVGETVAERFAAYWPLGIGEVADLVRGRSKFDGKVTRKTLYDAKKSFLEELDSPIEAMAEGGDNVVGLHYMSNPDYVEATHLPLETRMKEPRTVPLTAFRHKDYALAA